MVEMQSDRVEAFADNWSYLKAELNWLDRMLMLAVARQRKEMKDIDRVAQTSADRVSSHWWKGLIALDSDAVYEEGSPMRSQVGNSRPTEGNPKMGYQQQLQIRIQASQRQGVHLGLPLLCDRLHLTGLEKSVVLMSLAPEVNRRYGKIYHYLQSHEGQAPAERYLTSKGGSELPTVDLVLRLLCRNDSEWRLARNRLKFSSPLHHYALLRSNPLWEETFLARPLQLTDTLIDFLLADDPSPTALDRLLQPGTPLLSPPAIVAAPKAPGFLKSHPPQTSWSHLVLPDSLLLDLQYLVHRTQMAAQVENGTGTPGSVVLLVGAPGTGKTLAAATIAQALEVPLTWINLDWVEEQDTDQVFREIADQAPKVLLIQSAQHWLGRRSPVKDTLLQHFLHQRHTQAAVTLFSMTFPQAIRRSGRQGLDQVLEFPLPDEAARAQLWQQAIPPHVTVDARLKWQALARRWPLTGGEICAIVQDAILMLTESRKTKLQLSHFTQAVERYQQKSQLR